MIKEDTKVVNAYIFPNGMIMAFNAAGKQVPEYQGHRDEVADKIARDFPSVELRSTVFR